MERKIIGYQVLDQYKQVAARLFGRYAGSHSSWRFGVDSVTCDKFKEANVLDAWCDPIFEKKKLELNVWKNVFMHNSKLFLGRNEFTSKEAAKSSTDFPAYTYIDTINIIGTFEIPDLPRLYKDAVKSS